MAEKKDVKQDAAAGSGKDAPPTPQKGEELPVEVQAAVEELDESPDAVLEFKVYPNKVSVILLDYRKYTFSLEALGDRLKKLVKK